MGGALEETTRDAPEADEDEDAFNNAIQAASNTASSTTDTVQSPETTSPTLIGDDDSVTSKTRGNLHGRQPSLSLQSKIRSTSFRRTSTNGPLSPPTPAPLSANLDLPPLTPEGDTMPDIYRKQALRVEELDRENRRLEREVKESELRWRKGEEELEKLREVSSEAQDLKLQARKAQNGEKEIERLRAEVAALTRQSMQRSASHSVSKGVRTGSIPDSGSEESWRKDLESKDSTIGDMELEISRLRGQLSSQTQGCETHGEQITALQYSLTTTQGHLKSTEMELGDVRKALQRASEKAVRDGTERTSTDTKIRALEREMGEAVAARDEVVKKAENLEKKVEAMNKLHRETEARNASKLATAETHGREAVMLKARLATAENENLRLREERDRRKKRDTAGGGADEGLDEMEDDAYVRLQRQIRELESENFDLRRGVWRDKRKELQPNVAEVDADGNEVLPAGSEGFDEVDLSSSGPGTRRRSFANALDQPQQKHSSFSTVLNSGLAAFRAATASPAQQQRPRQDSLLEEFDEDLGGDGFDEQAFAQAQREEDMRKMVEHVREVKRKLREWEGWRLDLVEARRGGNGFGVGDIFEV